MRNSIIAFFLFNYILFSQEIEFKGYFDYTYNNDNGKITLAIDKLDQEFLYVNSLSRGVGNNDLGLDRGQLGNARVVYFTKKGDKIFLIQPNLKFISTSNNNLENKAVNQAFARSVLYGFKILNSKDNKHYIDLTPFILKDAHGVSNRLKNSNSGTYSLDLSKSAIDLERTKAFPKNIEFDVMLTFIGNPKGSLLRDVTPTPSNLTVNQHHSFIRLPDNNYKKRRFDPRSGSNPFIVFDYSTPINEPTEQKYIVRHRLEKKENESVISEAIEPIVYYLDNGTPEPVKTALIEGGRWWNQAFESIGYKNAFQIKILPEDADPMDIRYNLIQWIHRSTRGWSYGASIVDPRTGEIIKGQVSLGSLRVRQDYMILLGLTENPNDEINNKKIVETSLDRIRQLSAHEIGHTLGFAHNYLSSISNRSSVMDYPHPKIDIINDKINLDNAYDKNIGEWDKVSVAYAYSDFSKDKNEFLELNRIIEDASNKGLGFISDSDSRPFGSAHPFSHLWDNGDLPYKELNKLIRVREIAINNIDLNYLKDNEPYSKIEDILVPIYLLHRYQIEATAKAIGGLNYQYFVKTNKNEKIEFVNNDLQINSLQSLMNVVNPENLILPKELIKIITPRSFRNNRTRENFESKTGVVFDYISASSSILNHTFNLLLDYQRVNRIVQQNMLNKRLLSLDEYLDVIINSVYKFKSSDPYQTEINKNSRSILLDYIFNIYNHSELYDNARSILLDKIIKLKRSIVLKVGIKEFNPKYAFDRFQIQKIDDFLDNPKKFNMIKNYDIPDGSPIGDFSCDY